MASRESTPYFSLDYPVSLDFPVRRLEIWNEEESID